MPLPKSRVSPANSHRPGATSPGAPDAPGFTTGDVTRVLNQIHQGDPVAAEKLLPLLYEELRALARRRLAREKPGQTLQATALVHEAYLRLVNESELKTWDSRGHFFAAAAEAMRRILIESARCKSRLRHGSGKRRVDLTDIAVIAESDPDYLFDLNEALDRFAQVDRDTAELVKLRLFAGMTNDETASVQNIPASTAKKRWMYARAWLRRKLADEPGE